MANSFTDQPGPSFNSTALASSYAGATWTPPVGSVVFAFVVNSKGAAADTPTLSGNGQTWTQQATLGFDTAAAPTRRLTVFRSLIGAGPTTTALTADFAGSDQTGCSVLVVSVAGCKTTGTNGADAVVQAVTNYLDTTANKAHVALADFANHSNSTVACVAVSGTTTADAVYAAFTLGTKQAFTGPPVTGNPMWSVVGDALPFIDWTGPSPWGFMALEIAVLTPDASATSINRGPFVGGVTATAAKFVTVTNSGGTFTFKYGTDPNLVGATEVSENVGASTGFAKITSVSGLTANTTYYHQAVGDVTSSAIHSFKTFPAAPTTCRLGLLSDFQQMVNPGTQPPGTAFVNLDAEVPNLVWIGGDFDHDDPGVDGNAVTTRTNFRAKWNRMYDHTAYGPPPYSMPDFVASILRKYPTFHHWDDHDYHDNNANKGANWKDVVSKAEFKRWYPTYTLPSVAGGIWHSFTYGQVGEFFVLDSRSQRDVNGDADDADKSMLDGDALGATGQLQWLFDGLVASTARWKLLCTAVAWNPTALKTDPSRDNWCGFITEQRRIIRFITDHHIDGCVIVSGDTHMGALDDGRHSVIPEVIVPPPNFIAGGLSFNNFDVTGRWSHGTFENNGYVLIEMTMRQMTIRVKDVNGAQVLVMTLPATPSETTRITDASSLTLVI